MAITQTLTPFPDPPRIYQPEEEFDAKADEMAGHLPILVTEINEWGLQANATATDITNRHNDVIAKHQSVTTMTNQMQLNQAALDQAVSSAQGSATAASGSANAAATSATAANTSKTDAATSAANAAAAAAAAGAEKTVYVSGTGSDSAGTGASDAPYLTVAKAVNSQPMGAVVNVQLQSGANTGAIDVKNRSVSIYAAATAPLTFTATIMMNGGLLRVFAQKIRVESGLSTSSNHQFLVTGSGVCHFGGYNGCEISYASNANPICLTNVDYDQYSRLHAYLGRVSKIIANTVYARSVFNAGTATAELWQCTNISDNALL